MTLIAQETAPSLAGDEYRELLAAELNHWVRNMLAIVQALVAQTIRGTHSTEQFREALSGRIRSLAAVHDLLAQRDWRSVELGALVRRLLRECAGSGRIDVAGPEIRLSPNAAVSIALALHELATNAFRHGALSVPFGVVTLHWRVRPEGTAGGTLHLTWSEQGEPATRRRPRQRGFGLRLIEGVGRELGARSELRWGRSGLKYSLLLPLGGQAAVEPDSLGQSPGLLDLRH